MVISTRTKFLAHETVPAVMLLGATTGWVDALTYQFHDQRFAAFQTGNIIQTGINLAKGDFSKMTMYLVPILFFALGAGVNYLIKTYFKSKNMIWQQLSLLIEILGILLMTFIEHSVPSSIFIAGLAFFMAIQADTFSKVNGIPVATAFSTGNVRTVGSNIMAGIATGDKTKFVTAGKVSLLVLGFLLGALVSTLTAASIGTAAMYGAVVLLGIVFTMMTFKN